MTFILNNCIDEFIRRGDDSDDKAIAYHLKEIIPQTTHFDKNTFNEIIEEFGKEIEKEGVDFKSAFHKLRPKYILLGDIIRAELPGVLFRIIPHIDKFLEKILNNTAIPGEKIKNRITAIGTKAFTELISQQKLAADDNNVVFATFDEENPGIDPFINCSVIDIINMLALPIDVFEEDEPFTAVKIKYSNKKDLEKKFPIFFDAGWYDKFYPSNEDDKYGRTRSLDKRLKNMPEIVHKNVEISEVIEDIEFLKD